MELEINVIIKGGTDLEKFYPVEYQKFVDDLNDRIFDRFPGVMGCIINTEMTDYERQCKQAREKAHKEELEKAVVDFFKDPEWSEKLMAKVTGTA